MPFKTRRDWHWVEFEQVASRRLPNNVYTTLNPKGEFVFNLSTFIRLNEPEAVVLLFDPDTDTIGIKPSRAAVPNAIIVRTRHHRYNKVVRSRPFLRKHDIRIDRTVQFPNAEIQDGILILNLRDRVAAGHMPWKGGRR